MRRERGTSLIFVLGILALLSLFAISFATVTRVERVASANYVDEVRARLAARAGLAAGIAAAHEAFRQPSPGAAALGGYLDSARTILSISGTNITLGNPTGIAAGDKLTLFGGTTGASQDVTVATGYVTGTNPVVLTSAPSSGRIYALPRGANWFYHGHSLNPQPTGNGIPIALSLTTASGSGSGGHGVPSLHIATGATLTPLVRLASGSTGGTYFADPAPSGTPYICGGDIYATKILDAGGMLDANMDQSDLSPLLTAFGTDVLAEVKKISDDLAAVVPNINNVIPLKDAANAAYPNPFGTGANITAFFAYRDKLSGKRFQSKEQLKGAFQAISGGDPAKGDAWFALFRDFFTCYGDYDGNEVAGDDPAGSWNPPGGVPVSGGVPDKSQMFQNKKKSDTPGAARASVNLNTASAPVLYAVISSVRAKGLPTPVEDGGAVAVAPISINPGIVPMAPWGNAGNGSPIPVTHTDAVPIADALVKARPFRSWNEVYKCLNTLRAAGGAPSDAVLGAVLAALCPVELPLAMNPDRSMYFWDASFDPDDPTPTNVGFKVKVEKAMTHSCADFSFTSGYFEIEAVGRVYANPSAPYIVAEASKRSVVNVGGVVWVRGQRDLSRQLAGGSDVMGAPATAAGDAFVGGWIQPKPFDKGLTVAGGLVGAAPTMTSWTPTLADGFNMQRTQWTGTGKDVIIAHAGTSPSPDDKGQVEMWVKQPFDGDKGSNEAFFMNVRNYNSGLRHAEPGFTDPSQPLDPATVTQIGVATRLERFGNKLYFCRFFWGYPDGASPAKVGEEQDNGAVATAANPTTKYVDNMHGYITSQALSWKAGTWHHVFISWDVMQMKMYIDGKDQGAASLPADYKGGVVWENTVQGFFPDAGSGGLDNNNQFKNVARDTAGEQQVRNAMNAAQAHIPVDDGIINNPSSSQTQKTQAQQHKQQDQDTVNDGNDWFQGGSGHGNFATDVHGMSFTAQLGLRRMKLRTHLPIPGAGDAAGDAGMTESYFLGYKTPDPYNNESPPEIVTLNFHFGGAGSSFYQRYSNGTFDAIKWSQAPNLGGPTPVPHRYDVASSGNNGTFSILVTLPASWIPVAHGAHVIAAYGVFLDADAKTPDLYGAGRADNMTVAGRNVTVTRTFPAGQSSCSVAGHAGNCVAGSNVLPWAVSGVWIAYEKPTTFLEAPEVD